MEASASGAGDLCFPRIRLLSECDCDKLLVGTLPPLSASEGQIFIHLYQGSTIRYLDRLQTEAHLHCQPWVPEHLLSHLWWSVSCLVVST